MRLITLCILSSVLCACGGGGGGDGGPPTTDLVLPSAANLDGAISNTGLAFSNTAPLAGDTSTDLIWRGVVAFDIRVIPAGAEIQSATLRIYQNSAPGTPYATYGDVIVDHFRVGSSLDAGDFTGQNEQAAMGTLSTNENVGYKELTVTSRVIEDMTDGRDSSAYRLRLANDSTVDGDGNDDAVLMTDAEDTLSAGNPPQLVVRYTLP